MSDSSLQMRLTLRWDPHRVLTVATSSWSSSVVSTEANITPTGNWLVVKCAENFKLLQKIGKSCRDGWAIRLQCTGSSPPKRLVQLNHSTLRSANYVLADFKAELDLKTKEPVVDLHQGLPTILTLSVNNQRVERVESQPTQQLITDSPPNKSLSSA